MARRRRFEPAALVAGLVFLAVAAGFGCDAAGAWHPAPLLTLPVVVGGLLLTGVVRAVTALRRRNAPLPTGGLSGDGAPR